MPTMVRTFGDSGVSASASLVDPSTIDPNTLLTGIQNYFGLSGIPITNDQINSYLAMYATAYQAGDTVGEVLQAWPSMGVDATTTAAFVNAVAQIYGGNIPINPNESPSVSEIVSTDVSAVGSAVSSAASAVGSGISSGFTKILPWAIGGLALYFVLTSGAKAFVAKRL